MARLTGQSVTAFDLNSGDVLALFDDATLTVDNDEEDGSGASVAPKDPIAIRCHGKLDWSGNVDAVCVLAAEAISGATFAIALTSGGTGASDYAGTGFIKSYTHTAGPGLQKVSMSIVTVGTFTAGVV